LKQQSAFIPSVLLFLFLGCKDKRGFNQAKDLSDYKQTQFIPTLEHKISNDINSVYCATLLIAWNEIRKQINSPLTISNKYFDLNLLNKSTSFENVLKTNEYNVRSEVEGGLISVRAEFYKSLPFERKLKSFKDKLIFNKQKITSFGVNGHEDYDQLSIVQILYYKNDNNFIIKLLPKDKEHEIVLFTADKRFNSIAEMNTEIEKLTAIGKPEKKSDKTSWKYFLQEQDIVVIPKFNFNIETNYSSVEGNEFKTNRQSFQLDRVWQRTAFILDEKGAEIESEVAVAAACLELENEKPKPKKMILDKPFLILLKRSDASNPYFGLWITNTELMIKE
jgi:hypothetical protein